MRTRSSIAACLIAVAVLAAGASAGGPAPSEAKKPAFRVLVFSRALGFHHDSIPAGVAAIRALGHRAGFSMTATTRAGKFTRKALRRFAAVVFLNTTGDVLGPGRQKAFRSYIRHGGGFAGVHSAADTEYDWSFYGRLVGAYLESHPAVQPGLIEVVDRKHPSTRGLPAHWSRTDEWYDFRSNPRRHVHVLAVLDPSSYSGSAMGPDHPIAWCHRVARGRAWYTGGGHTIEAFGEADFRRHLLGGILWAAGKSRGSCRV